MCGAPGNLGIDLLRGVLDAVGSPAKQSGDDVGARWSQRCRLRVGSSPCDVALHCQPELLVLCDIIARRAGHDGRGQRLARGKTGKVRISKMQIGDAC